MKRNVLRLLVVDVCPLWPLSFHRQQTNPGTKYRAPGTASRHYRGYFILRTPSAERNSRRSVFRERSTNAKRESASFANNQPLARAAELPIFADTDPGLRP